jgi:hypothetical protein
MDKAYNKACLKEPMHFHRELRDEQKTNKFASTRPYSSTPAGSVKVRRVLGSRPRVEIESTWLRQQPCGRASQWGIAQREEQRLMCCRRMLQAGPLRLLDCRSDGASLLPVYQRPQRSVSARNEGYELNLNQVTCERVLRIAWKVSDAGL